MQGAWRFNKNLLTLNYTDSISKCRICSFILNSKYSFEIASALIILIFKIPFRKSEQHFKEELI